MTETMAVNQAADEGETVMITLLAEPEAFQDLATGTIREQYILDGQQIECHLAGEGLVLPALTVQLLKTADDRLEHVYLDILNLRGKDLKRIAQVTGEPEDLAGIDDDESVQARFELRPEALGQYVQPALDVAETLEAFLDVRDDDGLPVLFDFANYVTEGVLTQP